MHKEELHWQQKIIQEFGDQALRFRGHLGMKAFYILLKQYPVSYEYSINKAAMCGEIQILEWLKSRGKPITQTLITSAIIGIQEHVIDWLEKEGVKATKADIIFAEHYYQSRVHK